MISRIEKFLEKIRSEKADVEAGLAKLDRLSVKYEGAVEVLEALIMELGSESELTSTQIDQLVTEVGEMFNHGKARAEP